MAREVVLIPLQANRPVLEACWWQTCRSIIDWLKGLPAILWFEDIFLIGMEKNMKRSQWLNAMGMVVLGAGMLGWVGLLGSGCKQGEGDRCELNSDCETGLECCLGANSQYKNTCRSKCNPCGDGILDPGEVCDDGNTVSGDGCKGDCSSDETCGNGIVDTHLAIPEDCDPGATDSGVDCVDLGFLAGKAVCRSDCTLDLSGCEEGCGNDIIDGDDVCDGTDLGGATCESLGFGGGTLSCGDECHFDETACTDGCGNGLVDAGEDCDGALSSAVTCESLGYSGGTVTCGANCQYDVSECQGLAATKVVVDATTLLGEIVDTTEGHGNRMTASCQPFGGAEALFEPVVPLSGWYLVGTQPMSAATALDDTIVTVFAGEDNSTEWACNDNDGPGRMAAAIAWFDPQEKEYVSVEGGGGSQGAFNLVVRGVHSPSGNCQFPVVLSGPGLYGVVIDADQDGAAQMGSCVGSDSPEAVFRYRVAAAGSVRIQAESIGGAPFGLYVRTGACDATGSVEQVCRTGSYEAVDVIVSGLTQGQNLFVFVEGNREDARTPVSLYVTEE